MAADELTLTDRVAASEAWHALEDMEGQLDVALQLLCERGVRIGDSIVVNRTAIKRWLRLAAAAYNADQFVNEYYREEE